MILVISALIIHGGIIVSSETHMGNIIISVKPTRLALTPADIQTLLT